MDDRATTDSGTKLRVLHVEAVATLADDVRDILRGATRYDAELETAGSRDDALAALVDHGPFDLAIIDQTLPGRESLEVIEDIAAHAPTTATVAVVAAGDDAAIEAVLRRGASWFVAASNLGPSTLLPAIAHAIDRKSFERELQIRANTDPLTGLLNRFALETRYPMAAASARRHARHLAVVVLDLNRFKLVNDNSGHLAGDQVLRTVADRLRETAREGDLIVRVGGDEFVIIGTDLDPALGDEVAVGFGERIRATVDEPPIRVGVDRVTTAMGAVASNGDDDLEALLSRADQAMFADKGDAAR